jgi:hypothetical protein
MWNVKSKVISVITEATGTISKSFRQYRSNTPGKPENQGTKKNGDSGHCTHTAESANVRVQNIFNTRNNITCSTHCKYRTAAKLYTIERWFVSGI